MSKDDKLKKPIQPTLEPEVDQPFFTESEEVTVEQGKESGVGTFQISAHLHQQQLRYVDGEKHQLELFDNLPDQIQNDIEEGGVIPEDGVFSGIDLTATETIIVNAISKLLYKNSETSDPDSPRYFTGSGTTVRNYGRTSTATIPEIEVSVYDIATAMYPSEKPSGKQLQNIKNTLIKLSEKPFLIKYKEVVKTNKKKGTEIIDYITEYAPLYTLKKVERFEGKDGKVEELIGKRTVLVLHPIFNRQIDGKYVLMPNDITERTAEAHGGKKIPLATIKLRDWALDKISIPNAPKENVPIGEKKLLYLVDSNSMNRSKKTRADKNLKKAIETCIDMGIILSYRKAPAPSIGGIKYLFNLNKDYTKG